MNDRQKRRRAATMLGGVAALVGGAYACTVDTSFLGCTGLAGAELATCEAANRCLGLQGAELEQCKADNLGGAGGQAGGGGQGAGGGPVMGAAGSGSGGAGGNGGLVCTAPTVDCNGTCINVKTDDAANCGACGRSCLGTATCAAGACVPEPMAANEVAPYALADDGTSLYWVSPAIKAGAFIPRMRRVAKATAGGTAANVFSSAVVRARSLTFAGGKLFWGDLGVSPTDDTQKLVAGLPTASFPIDPPIAADQLNVQRVALASTKVYWSVATDAAVRGKNADGTGAVSPNVLGQSSVGWLAVDVDAVPYWVASAGGGQREVRRLKMTPPNTHEPVASGPNVVAVELAGGRFYWADGAAIRSRPKAAPTETPRDEFSGQGTVEGFAVSVVGAGGAGGAGGSSGAGGAGGAGSAEGVTLYVLTAQGRQLKAWRKGPDDDTPLLLGEVTAKADPYNGNPFGAAYVLVDGQYVYFADVGTLAGFNPDAVQLSNGDGVVYRVAR